MPKQVFVQVTSKGKNPLQWFKEVDAKIHFELQAKLVELGEQTAIRMGDIIRASIKRPGSTGLLENSIKSYLLNSTGGVTIGIGKISDLPKYWEVINSGGYVPPANIGFFDSGAPVKGGSGEQWHHTGGQEVSYGFEKSYFIHPKKPIEPVRYVDIAAQELTINIGNAVKEFMKEIEK